MASAGDVVVVVDFGDGGDGGKPLCFLFELFFFSVFAPAPAV